MIKFERYATSDMRTPNRSVRSLLERSVAARALLKLFSVFGVALVIAGTSSQLKGRPGPSLMSSRRNVDARPIRAGCHTRSVLT